MNSTLTPQLSRKQKQAGFWQRASAKRKDDQQQALAKKRAKIALDNSAFEVLPMCGVQVKLPVGLKPYPSQKLIITRIITSLNKRLNVLVESPTGSGKTLALLSSTCAWLIKYREERQESRSKCLHHNEKPEGSDMNSSDSMDSTSVNRGSICPELLQTPVSKKGFDEDVQILNSTYEYELSIDFIVPATPSVSNEKENCEKPAKKEVPQCTCLPKVRIYYGTRTHKQIGQVVKEFSRLPYAGVLKHTVLASRDQTCVNEAARQSGDLTSYCKELISQDGAGCSFKSNMKGLENPVMMRRHVEANAPVVFDIEDLVQGLRVAKPSICPYFTATRILTSDADIVFCPFTYLVDPIIRNSSDVHLKNSVVILDEAHNIEDTCREGASFSFYEKEIADALTAFTTKGKALDESLRRGPTELGSENEETLKTLEEYHEALKLLSSLMSSIWEWFREVCHGVNSMPSYRDDFKTTTKTWGLLAASLEAVRKNGKALLMTVDSQEYTSIKDALTHICGAGMDPGNPSSFATTPFKPVSSAIVTIEKWLYFLGFFSNEQNRRMFRLNVCMEGTQGWQSLPTRLKGAGAHDGQGPKNSMYSNAEIVWMDSSGVSGLRPVAEGYKTSVSMWCMNPSLAFRHAFEDTRAVILASGTLCPMETLKTELGMPFPTIVEGGQVIPSEQIYASVITRGPQNCPLYVSQAKMNANPSILKEVAQIVQNICLTVPSGILCFLPSYRMMTDLINYFKSEGLTDIIQQKKMILEEPRRSSDMNSVMSLFDEIIERPKSYGPKVDGALLLAVFRGKISEGIDFADDKARVVISVGIPYPNWGDELVQQKRKYNDENSKILKILNGDAWYTTQAYRALNQALGRCLRHKNDWGALVLIDERLAQQTTAMPATSSATVSRWIREKLIVNSNYNEFEASLTKFVRSMRSESFPATTMS